MRAERTDALIEWLDDPFKAPETTVTVQRGALRPLIDAYLAAQEKGVRISNAEGFESHGEVLTATLDALVSAGWAPRQEIMKEWLSLLQIELEKGES